MQRLVKECPYYCSTYTLTYPKHLNMTGRFNSLFGIDKELLEHPEKIAGYIIFQRLCTIFLGGEIRHSDAVKSTGSILLQCTAWRLQ